MKPQKQTQTYTHRGKGEKTRQKKNCSKKMSNILPDDVERELCFSLP